MDAYKTIITKRDTREYSDKPISEESLRRILQAGRMAGSSKNSQPCRFVVIRDPEKKREFASCGHYAQHVPNASVVIVIVIPEGAREFDAGRAAQNMMLAAWAEGITSCATSMHEVECARRVLGLPDDYHVVIALPFGYPPPAGLRSAGRQRLPLEELVHEERWQRR